MPDNDRTVVSHMHMKSHRVLIPVENPLQSTDDVPPVKDEWGSRFGRNLAVASALVLCAVALRYGAIPALTGATDVVMTAATDQSLLDDQLGKLSFVSSLFPEAVLVFGEHTPLLDDPVEDGDIVHTWSAAEPYVTWSSNTSEVLSATDGEVIGVYHGNGDERLVQVMGNDGLACLYGNLGEVWVELGDRIRSGDSIGELLTDSALVFEVRRNGISVDPRQYLPQ